jgi:hypothetical protein
VIGHFIKECTNARKLDRDDVAIISIEEAWEKLKRAAQDSDIDDAKEALQEYVKANQIQGVKATYKEIQEACIGQAINFWMIATERELLPVFTNMDLQGNLGKKYSVSYRFSKDPRKPIERDGWPASMDELLNRLEDAGDIVDRRLPRCIRCGEMGHTTKTCTEEKVERPGPNPCPNCGAEGHRLRACPEPIVDKFACRNCGYVNITFD